MIVFLKNKWFCKAIKHPEGQHYAQVVTKMRERVQERERERERAANGNNKCNIKMTSTSWIIAQLSCKTNNM